MIQWMLVIWSLFPLPFLNAVWISGSSQFMYYWSLTWRILSTIMLVREMSAILSSFEHCLHCPSLGLGWKLTLSSPVASAEFSKFSGILSAFTFKASHFRIWNSPAGIPSPLLALIPVMLPKALLTSHSRMSNSRWVITPSWLSGSLKCLVHSSFVFSCHLFLISSAFAMSVLFLPFIVFIFVWNVSLASLIFLKISLAFPILEFSSISLHCSLRKAFLSLLAILWNSVFIWVYLSSLCPSVSL